MSIHPSLSSAAKGRRHRSVLKRFERLKILLEKEKWAEGNSVFGLPKVKILKVKIKKEKAEEAAPAEAAAAEAAGPAEGGPAEGASAPTPGAKKERSKE